MSRVFAVRVWAMSTAESARASGNTINGRMNVTPEGRKIRLHKVSSLKSEVSHSDPLPDAQALPRRHKDHEDAPRYLGDNRVLRVLRVFVVCARTFRILQPDSLELAQTSGFRFSDVHALPPNTEQPANDDQFAQVIRRVIGRQDQLSQIRLPLAMRNSSVQIDALIRGQLLKRLPVLPESPDAFVPFCR